MDNKHLPKEFIKKLKSVEAKRPKTVIDHILKHGYITTEELKTNYGYNHPPRAARDVREVGIPLETFRVRDSEGRSIGAYRFADPSKARFGTLDGRKVFTKAFKQELIDEKGCKCEICFEPYEDRYLQIDHRIPYEVDGDIDEIERNIADYMLLCGSCNRAKSWSCEHCLNWQGAKDSNVCKICYWANPESYSHIALREIRRLEIVWTKEEIGVYNQLLKDAKNQKIELPEHVKNIIQKYVLRRL
jgi:hypothetical protein